MPHRVACGALPCVGEYHVGEDQTGGRSADRQETADRRLVMCFSGDVDIATVS
jgi:hypothetical protein